MNSFDLVIHGDPVAKGRGRIVKMGAHMGIKTPDKTRRYEDIVRQRATVEWNGAPLIDATPVTLKITFFRGVAESWSKKKRAAALLGEIRPTCSPDLDNLEKAVNDALNGVVYRDDSLICEKHSAKFYALEPRVEVTLTW